MYTLCWSPKGGSGTTVVAATLAVLAARRAPTVIVDLGGDIGAALGVDVSGSPGVGDWLCSSGAPATRLWQLAHTCSGRGGHDLCLVPQGAMPPGSHLTDLAAERLATAAAQHHGHVVIDAGRILPQGPLLECASRSLLIVRPCYLALRRACSSSSGRSDLVLITEPRRTLSRHDVEHALGEPVVAELPWDPAVARAVDAGLLAMRVPSATARVLGRLLS
ncbi:MAG: hypothetical protein HZB15_05525 [Actinobacteria bacterium]|nr:hypothetical protein [Actinomycetota bacterium]